MNDFHDVLYVIGKARTIKLFILIVLNALVFAAIFLYFEPETKRVDNQVQSVSQEISRLRGEIQGMPALLEEYKKNEGLYENVVSSGFVGEQDRILARKLIDYFRVKSNVSSVQYELSPLQHAQNDYRMMAFKDEEVQTSIKLEIGSTLDLETFGFVQYFEDTLPGILVLRKLSVNRTDMQLDSEKLAEIAKGKIVQPLVEAELEYDWVTLSPRVAPNQTY